jgi:cellulose synthase/poly-beta-1,6-N-acetylglucosamine synthase-like glycosyltransferase
MNLTTIDVIFFIYIFLGLYMSVLLILIYIPNRKRMFYHPPSKPEPVSIVMPCYNEGKTIGKAIESLLNLDYPKNMIEIIIVDDKSKDNSVEIARQYEKKYKNIKVIVNKRNSGGAAEPTNIGIKKAKHDYIAVTDADSTPAKDALKKMLGYLQEDPTVAGVTCSVLVKNPRTWFQKLQAIEYKIIAFTRRLLDLIDAVYVTPGPFALYKKKALEEVGYFDTKNLTQDIEIVWRLRMHGYRARMCLSTQVHSECPEKFKQWWRQRIRWSIGGTQTNFKYMKYAFSRGMFGHFIIPFFTLSLFLGMFGLAMFSYLFTRSLLISYLSTKYSIYAQSTVIALQDLTFAPSVLNFFGVALFFLALGFTLFSLANMKDDYFKKAKTFNILLFQLVYLTVYPIVTLVAIIKLARGKYSW